jgi:hypothetical protein
MYNVWGLVVLFYFGCGVLPSFEGVVCNLDCVLGVLGAHVRDVTKDGAVRRIGHLKGFSRQSWYPFVVYISEAPHEGHFADLLKNYKKENLKNYVPEVFAI